MDNTKAKNIILFVLVLIFMFWFGTVIKNYFAVKDKTKDIFKQLKETEEKYDNTIKDDKKVEKQGN